VKTRPGDALLLFCSSLYISRIAWERGHWVVVLVIWAVAFAANALGRWAENRANLAAAIRLEAMTRKLQERGGTPR